MAVNDGVAGIEEVYESFHRLHLALATHEYWEEFKQHCKVDRKTGRDLYAGVIRAVNVRKDEEEFKMIAFLHLLSRLVDGSDPDTEYMDTAEGTPLETALGIFENITARTECLDDDDVQTARILIRKQAVVVCIQVGNHNKAQDVFHRLWDEENLSAEEQTVKDELAKILKYKTGVQKQKFIRHNSYERFHKAIVKILEKVHQNFKTPFLLDVVKKKLTREKCEDETQIDSDEMDVDVEEENAGGKEDETAEGSKKEMEESCEKGKDFQVNGSELRNCYEIMRLESDNARGWNKVKNFDSRIMAELRTARCGSTSRAGRSRKGKGKRLRKTQSSQAKSPNKNRIYVEETDSDDGSQNNNNNQTKDEEDAKRRKRSRDPGISEQEESDVEGRGHVSPEKKLKSRRETRTGGNSAKSSVDQVDPVDGKSLEDGADDDSSADTTPRRDKKRLQHRYHLRGGGNEIQGEVVTWSDSDSDIATPPSRLPTLPNFSPRKMTTPSKIKTSGGFRRPWSEQEIANLKRGVNLYGTGNWKMVLNSFEFNNRTNVNLKDKWRTMERRGEV